jgi:hypothetical protein
VWFQAMRAVDKDARSANLPERFRRQPAVRLVHVNWPT